jgi:hypothetical protein
VTPGRRCRGSRSVAYITSIAPLITGTLPRNTNHALYIIISEVAVAPHKRDPEYCLLSEDRNTI